MELEELIEEYLQEFINKVAEAVNVKYGEEPSQSSLYLGFDNKGVGTRIEIEDRFSVDLSFQHLYEDPDYDNSALED